MSGPADGATHRAAGVMAMLTAAVGLAILARAVYLCSFGFDLTDESLYLQWIRSPWGFPVSISQFGFVYHPLHRLTGGDIVLMRAVNLVVTALLAAGASWLVMRRCCPDLPSVPRAAFAVALGTCGLVSLRIGLLTPSYNWLTLQALLVAGSGAVLVMGPRSRTGAVLLGLGGGLVFLAKPTSAGALALIAVAFLAGARALTVRTIAVASLTALGTLVAAAMAIDGSIVAFIVRHSEGLRDARLLSGDYAPDVVLRLEWARLTSVERAVYWGVFAWAAGAAMLALRGLRAAAGVLTVVPAIAAGGLGMGWLVWPWPGTVYSVVWIAAPAVAAAAAAFLAAGWGRWRAIPREVLSLAVLLAVMPLAYAFGTTGNYVRTGANAGIFWMLAALSLAGGLRGAAWQMIAPVIMSALVVMAALLQGAIDAPYRQKVPLTSMTAPVALGGGRPVRVSAARAEYVRALRAVAGMHGFRAGTPLIDLTGHTPGAAVVLDAETPGSPWLIGGYEGSEEFAIRTLGRAPCEDLARAWVLVEPPRRGRPYPRSLPASVLEAVGFSLSRDYVLAGTMMAPPGDYRSPVQQRLYAPLGRPDAFESCRAARVDGFSAGR